jgi:hypothetical protein
VKLQLCGGICILCWGFRTNLSRDSPHVGGRAAPPLRRPAVKVFRVINDATVKFVKRRATTEHAELRKLARADPEILGGFGGAEFSIFDRVHARLSRAPGERRGRERMVHRCNHVGR